MKSFTLLLPIISLAVATSFSFNENEQIPFGTNLQETYPGFDLDLSELRWVELEGQAPVLMSELEKVISMPTLYLA